MPAPTFGQQFQMATSLGRSRSVVPVDSLVEVARKLANRLLAISVDNELWDEIERLGNTPPATLTELRLLGFVDWDVVLGSVGHMPPPTGAELGTRIQAAARAALDTTFRPHHDLLNSVRERLKDLAMTLDRDAAAPQPDDPRFMERFRARIGAASSAVVRIDLSKLVTTAAKELVGKSMDAYKATVIGGVALVHPAAALPILLGAAGLGLAKEVIDAFHEGWDAVDDDKVQAELVAQTRWTDQCIVLLDHAANRGRIGQMAATLDAVAQSVTEAPEFARHELHNVRRWLAETTSTLLLLWDQLGPVWGFAGSHVIEQLTLPLAAAAANLDLAEQAIESANGAKDARESVGAARHCLDEVSQQLNDFQRALVANRLIAHHPPAT